MAHPHSGDVQISPASKVVRERQVRDRRRGHGAWDGLVDAVLHSPLGKAASYAAGQVAQAIGAGQGEKRRRSARLSARRALYTEVVAESEATELEAAESEAAEAAESEAAESQAVESEAAESSDEYTDAVSEAEEEAGATADAESGSDAAAVSMARALAHAAEVTKTWRPHILPEHVAVAHSQVEAEWLSKEPAEEIRKLAKHRFAEAVVKSADAGVLQETARRNFNHLLLQVAYEPFTYKAHHALLVHGEPPTLDYCIGKFKCTSWYAANQEVLDRKLQGLLELPEEAGVHGPRVKLTFWRKRGAPNWFSVWDSDAAQLRETWYEEFQTAYMCKRRWAAAAILQRVQDPFFTSLNSYTPCNSTYNSYNTSEGTLLTYGTSRIREEQFCHVIIWDMLDRAAGGRRVHAIRDYLPGDLLTGIWGALRTRSTIMTETAYTLEEVPARGSRAVVVGSVPGRITVAAIARQKAIMVGATRGVKQKYIGSRRQLLPQHFKVELQRYYDATPLMSWPERVPHMMAYMAENCPEWLPKLTQTKTKAKTGSAWLCLTYSNLHTSRPAGQQSRRQPS